MRKLLFAIIPLAMLASCGGTNQERKVLIVAPGTITLDATGKNISVGDTTSGADNKEIDLKDPSVTSLNINNNGAKSTINIPADAGYYIYNGGSQPIYGSELIVGKNIGLDHDLDLDEQKAYIDSVKQVLAGTNISAANKNYLINSKQIIRIGSSDAPHTHVFAPFVGISDVTAADDGKPVSLYKFYAKDELQQRLQTVEESYNAPGK